MATVNLIKAASRSRAGKGAARAERRAGRVPGIIYGDGKPPLPISLDYADLRLRIYAGHFLTTIHDVEIDGVKHRVGGIERIVGKINSCDEPLQQPARKNRDIDVRRLEDNADTRNSAGLDRVEAKAAAFVRRDATEAVKIRIQ